LHNIRLYTTKINFKRHKGCFSKTYILPERQLKINHLKERLDTLITQGIEVHDVFQEDIFRDHDYYKSNTESCVLYYICGYVSRYINKHIKCSDCQKAVIGKALQLNKL